MDGVLNRLQKALHSVFLESARRGVTHKQSMAARREGAAMIRRSVAAVRRAGFSGPHRAIDDLPHLPEGMEPPAAIGMRWS